MRLTDKQRRVLRALDPPEGHARDQHEVADRAGLSSRGALYVLYHLSDLDLIRVDEWGYYLSERGVNARLDEWPLIGAQATSREDETE